MASLKDMIIGVILLIVTAYAVTQVGLVIGDRFSTSDTLAINETTNPDGYAAQESVNESFYANIEFSDILIFLAIAVVALAALNYFGGIAT